MPKRLLNFLYLVALAAVVFAIPPTFHGDEPMQIYMSRDYVTAFIDGDSAALMTHPPYDIDTDPHLRLINGSVNRYAIGLAWHLAGYTAADLPPRPGWNWGLDYDANVANGQRPTDDQMAVARFPSALFLALSIPVIFAIGWHFGGRLPAYIVSALYALHPVILLNGRRAMQEGSMLFFGLSVILFALLITKRSGAALLAADQNAPSASGSDRSLLARFKTPAFSWLLWAGMISSGGLALASKHSAVVFVVGAWGWVFAAELARLRWRRLLTTSLKLAAAALLALLCFVLLSPALWDDPIARISDLLAARAELLDIQVINDPAAPLSAPQRAANIALEPFIAPPQHYEVAFWGTFPAITAAIERYMASPFSGIQFGIVLGGALTLLAALGIAVSLMRLRQRGGIYAGLLVWLLVIVASLFANPLPWQRYYLPLIPAAALLAALGTDALDTWARRFVRKSEHGGRLRPAKAQNS